MDPVTGAFSYTGRSITHRLLKAGREVRTLTGHPSRPDPFGGKVSVIPCAFDGRRPRLVHLPPTILIGLVKVLGLALGDVLLTVDEPRGLMAGLVATEGPPTGATRLSEWLDEHAGDIGRVYASELARHYR
jgi:hypothetical protein